MTETLFRLRPYPRPMLWAGGRLDAEFEPEERGEHGVGESLEASALPGMDSAIVGGSFDGRSLRDLVGARPEMLDPRAEGRFPLLVKRLDAGARLSFQVHPDDEGARRLEGHPNGKCEAWVVLAAEPGAGVWLGFREGVGREEILGALGSGTVLDLARFLPVRVGDVLPVPAGCAHAIGEGVTVFEVQQPADITYRIYDHGRTGPDGRPRPLQIERALEVLDPELRPDRARPVELDRAGVWRRDLLLEMPAFRIERWGMERGGRAQVEGGALRVLHAVRGGLTVRSGEQALDLAAGKTLLAGASSPRIEVESAGGFDVLVAGPGAIGR